MMEEMKERREGRRIWGEEREGGRVKRVRIALLME